MPSKKRITPTSVATWNNCRSGTIRSRNCAGEDPGVKLPFIEILPLGQAYVSAVTLAKLCHRVELVSDSCFADWENYARRSNWLRFCLRQGGPTAV